MANVFSNIKQQIKRGAYNAVSKAGQEVCDRMKQNLTAEGHAGSGSLIDSMTYEVTESSNSVSVDVHLADYAKYIEHGTGKYAQGGRQTPWRYKDRDGNWHTTSGMAADPFIEPAVSEVTASLQSIVDDMVNDALRGRSP